MTAPRDGPKLQTTWARTVLRKTDLHAFAVHPAPMKKSVVFCCSGDTPRRHFLAPRDANYAELLQGNEMDMVLARTFLEIVAQGSFLAAARRLHVTRTAVSARVKSLEEQLGTPLFRRHKSGTVLTAAGERFLPYASSLLQVWERARHQTALPSGKKAAVILGCEPSLWDPLLQEWLKWMKSHAPQLAIRAEIGSSGELLEQLAKGALDIAIVYAPHHRPGIQVELLIEDKLVLVTTDPEGSAPKPDDYVFVDWGPAYGEEHRHFHPELSRSSLSSNFGPLVREYLLSEGGAGYFRFGVVRPYLESGKLRRVLGAPEFPYPAYAMYSERADGTVLAAALYGLRQVTGTDSRDSDRRRGA